MKEIIEWLIYIEDWACRIYQQTAQTFSDDKDICQFVGRIAGDEAMHYHFMNSALACVENNPQLASDILLDQHTIDRVERPLKEIENAISSGRVSKSLLLKSIWDTEQTEWNDIFLYVINALKNACPQFKLIGPSIQNHLRVIEGFLSRFEGGSHLASKIKTLPPVWEEKVLVVDDSEPMIELLQSIFSRDAVVHVSANGAEAFKMATRDYYAAIITDIDMPVMNGITFYQKMAQQYPKVGQRFIFMTGAADRQTIKYLHQQGLALMTKPFRIAGIRQAVHTILDHGAL